MAEESVAKRNTATDNPKAKTFENGWIVCRSQKRPELLYDFNTLTGEAVWRDPGKTAHNTAIIDKNKVPFDCHEPTEPPMDPNLHNHQLVTESSPAPNIYNKQIINKQFPAKPFTIPPFGNSSGACVPFGLIDPNTMNTMNGPPVWVAAPTAPQVLIPTMTSLNQVQTIYGNLDNIHLQNSSLTLSNRFQVLNQLNPGSPIGVNLQDEGSYHQSYNHQQPQRNYQQRHGKPNQRPVNNLKRHTDLRSKLSSRRRQDLNASEAGLNASEAGLNAGSKCYTKIADKLETDKKEVSVPVTETELNPDDNDEWLEAHTDSDGRALNMDIESFWDLGDNSASRDYCYIIPTTRVLLNNMRFLTSLVISDDRIRLLTPRDVVRALRSAAFSSNTRLADYASRARTFAIRQMKKNPNNLKDAPNIKACLELIAPNIHVVRLVDDKDILNQESINDRTITIAELKRFLSRSPKPKPQAVNKMQTICENIKIIVTNDEVNPESLPQEAQPQIQVQENPSKCSTTTSASTPQTPRLDIEKTGHKEIEIQTDLSSPLEKRTANACVQTDFDFTMALSSEIPNRNKTTETMNGADDISDKQTGFNFTLDVIKPKEISISSSIEAADASSGNVTSVTTTAAPRKIRLKRLQPANTGSNIEEKKPFKWRRRKSTRQTSQVEESHENDTTSTTPSSSLFQQNDNSMDCKCSDVSASAKVIDESSTSGVVSNSVDSNDFFKMHTQATRNESDQIVVYEVTSDFMIDRLNVRCDEWMSRFVQIMEEVLSQVLLLDPPFNDATLPPPWTFYEATVCVKRKFLNESTIVDASDKLAVFLLKINDDRGNIETHISPTDFMQMYTYGVNLVNKLQLVLKDCEDLQIASQNLTKLLSDIREPNLDESYDDESFNYDETITNSPDISGYKRSEVVTDMSTIISGAREISTPVNNVSPKSKEKLRSCNNSPARYSLRSSRSNTEQKKKVEEGQTDAVCSENKEYTLFSSLGLQKRDIKVDCSIARTITNSATIQPLPSPPLKQTQASDTEPKQEVVRKFSVCAEFEKRLNAITCTNTEVNHKEIENNYTTDHYAPGADVGSYGVAENVMENGGYTENYAFAGGDFTHYEPYDYENDNGGIIRTTAMDVDKNYEYTQSVERDADIKLKQIVRRITCKYRRWLTDLRKFCEVTNATIKNPDYHRQKSQTNVMENITKVGEHANNVCRRLKCILNRDPTVTSTKFRAMLKSYGIIDFDMSDTQMAEYRTMIENHLEVAERLLTCVTRLAEAVKVK